MPHRDLRDPEKLGAFYLEMRSLGVDIERASNLTVEPYQSGEFMSSDPALHHSRTPQNLGNLDDGGAS